MRARCSGADPPLIGGGRATLRSALRRLLRIAIPLALTSCAGLTPPPASDPSVRVPDSDPGPDPQAQSPGAPDDEPEYLTEAPGVSVRHLSRGQRDAFLAIANTERSACGKPHSLAQSLRDDPDCYDSVLVAQFAADAIDAGITTSVIRQEIPRVTEALRPQQIDTKGNPVYGKKEAPVTVVVFADFECPHCRAEAPKLRAAIDRSRGNAKLIFMHFPLSFHPMAKRAAIACEIAHQDGKFWEMHDLVFQNQLDLTEDKLLGFARQLGLDAQAFEAAYDADEGKDAVEGDVDEGKRLGIEGTPTVYVDGRKVSDVLFGGSVDEWIADALRRRG